MYVEKIIFDQVLRFNLIKGFRVSPSHMPAILVDDSKCYPVKELNKNGPFISFFNSNVPL